MELDLTISIGDILSAVVIVTAIIAIYFQARSVRISEHQLKVNVDDVKTLSLETKSIADQIRKEREIRQEMVQKKMEEFAEQMNYTSHVYEKAMYFYRALDSQTNEYIITLNLGMQSLIDEIRENEKDEQKLQRISISEQALKNMMSFIAVSQRWSDELKKHSDESNIRLADIKKNTDANEIKRLMAESNGLLKQQIDVTNKKYGDLITTPGDNFRKSRANLAQLFSEKR